MLVPFYKIGLEAIFTAVQSLERTVFMDAAPGAMLSTDSELERTFTEQSSIIVGDADNEDKTTGSPTKAVHIRVQQRNGRKSLTTVQGLDEKYDKRKILKGFKKEFCCNGTVVVDEQLGQILQLQGDQRKSVSQFLIDKNLAKKQDIKVHGF
eukprot:g8021.t1